MTVGLLDPLTHHRAFSGRMISISANPCLPVVLCSRRIALEECRDSETHPHRSSLVGNHPFEF
jgi:hypothetical protein